MLRERGGRPDWGQSVVAGAAYVPDPKLYENATGITQDYTHKVGVEHSEILASADTPAWVFDRLTLWNTVEASEKRKDAQVAPEIESEREETTTTSCRGGPVAPTCPPPEYMPAPLVGLHCLQHQDTLLPGCHAIDLDRDHAVMVDRIVAVAALSLE
jgi:MobA/MobL family